MKTAQKLATAVFTVVLLFIGVSGFAQTTPKGKFNFNIGIDALVPTSDLQNYTSNFGMGITPRLQYGLTNRLALTFTSGFYRFFSKTVDYSAAQDPIITNHQDLIPVKLGLKAFVSNNIYFGVEGGAGFETNDGISHTGAYGVGRNIKLIVAPAIGFATKHWDVGVRYENFSGHKDHYGTFGLRLAYGFGL
jgi:hypothetical protein